MKSVKPELKALREALTELSKEELKELLKALPEGQHHARTKRSRDYESENRIKDWAKHNDIQTLKKCLAEWMRDLKAWGGDVRDDIIRLEAAVGAAPGEPGDPPPAPRE